MRGPRVPGRRLGLLALLVLLIVPAAARGSLGALADTRIGTAEGAADFGTGGGAGATYPGATAPFGMVQLSPDTVPSVGNFGGGYTFGDRRLRGFSATHVSGGGCAGLGDVPVLPTTAPVTAAPTVLGSYDVRSQYLQSFTHAGEVAHPGDYRVTLGDGIRAELSATTRVGLMRFTFSPHAHASLLVNPSGSTMGDSLAAVAVDPARREVTGTVSSGEFCLNRDRYTLHFALRFDRRPSAFGTWTGQSLQPGRRAASAAAVLAPGALTSFQYHRVPGGPEAIPGDPTTGAQAGAYVSFASGGPVQARVALSTVSVAGARRNLDAEAPPRTGFDALRAAARSAWERRLERIRIRGGMLRDRRLFETALYHAQVMPNVISDADGHYRGMDGAVHAVPRGHAQYANFSGWDIYRTQIPLLALIDRPVARDVASSLVRDARQSGGLPKWSLLTGQANIMVGDSADPIIAAARAFGAAPADSRAALAAMVHGATVPVHSANGGYIERPGLADWLAHGYVGYERNTTVVGHTLDPSRVWGTAATSLEYAVDDFAIARFAAALGDRTTCRRFAMRTAAWRRLWDPARRLIRPRYATGAFATDDTPASDQGFVEGSEAQYAWAVPQDLSGLTRAMGGRAAAAARLRRFFTELNGGRASPYAFLGNEPTLHTPYVFDWLGDPGAGAGIVHRAMRTLYAPTPGGFPGNDDAGEMSAWWVMGALGLYPAIPGTGVLAVGSPLFPAATVQLAGGVLRIDAPGASATRPYVASLAVDGIAHRRAWLDATDLAQGAHLSFRLSDVDGRRWASAAAAAPPSFPPSAVCAGQRSALAGERPVGRGPRW